MAGVLCGNAVFKPGSLTLPSSYLIQAHVGNGDRRYVASTGLPHCGLKGLAGMGWDDTDTCAYMGKTQACRRPGHDLPLALGQQAVGGDQYVAGRLGSPCRRSVDSLLPADGGPAGPIFRSAPDTVQDGLHPLVTNAMAMGQASQRFAGPPSLHDIQKAIYTFRRAQRVIIFGIIHKSCLHLR